MFNTETEIRWKEINIKDWELIINFRPKSSDIKEITDILVKFTSLKRITLNWIKLTDIELEALSDSLFLNWVLENINLSFNNISWENINKFLKYISSSKSIKSFNLSFNTITNEWIKNILNNIQENNSIESLNLYENNFSIKEIKMITEYVLSHNDIKTVYINDHNFWLSIIPYLENIEKNKNTRVLSMNCLIW